MILKLFLELLWNQFYFQNYFCVAILSSPSCLIQKNLTPPLKKCSLPLKIFHSPPPASENFFPTLNLGWERHYALAQDLSNTMEDYAWI